MTELGSRLKQARQGRGVSLGDIAESTKISVATLEAIERSDFARLPGGIFSRSFVRAYALAVGVQPDEAVNEFITEFTRWEREAERTKKKPEITQDDREFLERQRAALRTLRTILVVVAIAVLGGLAYIAWIWWPGTTK